MFTYREVTWSKPWFVVPLVLGLPGPVGHRDVHLVGGLGVPGHHLQQVEARLDALPDTLAQLHGKLVPRVVLLVEGQPLGPVQVEQVERPGRGGVVRSARLPG